MYVIFRCFVVVEGDNDLMPAQAIVDVVEIIGATPAGG
jgi:hypothetical protein